MRDRIALGGGAGFDGPQPLKLRRRPRTSQLHPRAGQPDQRVVVFMIRCRSRSLLPIFCLINLASRVTRVKNVAPYQHPAWWCDGVGCLPWWPTAAPIRWRRQNR